MYMKGTEWCKPILNPLGLSSVMAAATLLPVALESIQGTVLIVAPWLLMCNSKCISYLVLLRQSVFEEIGNKFVK